MYKEYLAEFWYSAKTLENSKVSFSVPTGGIYGEVGVYTFRNAIGAHYLPHSREYVAPPFIDIVRPWFETIGYGETVHVKGTLKKSLLPPKWRLLMAQIIQCLGDIIIKLNKRHMEKVVPNTRFLSLLMMHKMKEGYGDGEVTPYSTHVFTEPVVFKAPKPPSNVERVPQGTKPGAKPGYKKHSTSSKQPSVSNKEAIKGGSSKAPTGSKTGHLKRKKESSLAIDSNPSHTSASTPAVAEMHKEDQQATDGPTSLGVTSEARVNPRLNSVMSAFNLNEPMYLASFIIHFEPASGDDALAVSTAKADPGKFAPSDFTKPNMLVKDWKLSSLNPQQEKGPDPLLDIFKDLDSPEDDPIIVVDDSDEDEEADEVHATTNSQKHKLELEKNKAKAEAALLKSQPSFPNVGQLNELLIELPGDLKEIPPKLEDFTKTVKSLTSQVAELKTLQWELPAEFLCVPSQVEMVQAKLKTLDALPSLLNKVTNALNQFA
ncbi:hypothetical protein Tco_0127571 [Tanacetum coccineum]